MNHRAKPSEDLVMEKAAKKVTSPLSFTRSVTAVTSKSTWQGATSISCDGTPTDSLYGRPTVDVRVTALCTRPQVKPTYPIGEVALVPQAMHITKIS